MSSAKQELLPPEEDDQSALDNGDQRERGPGGQLLRGHAVGAATRWGRPGAPKPGRRKGATLGDALRKTLTTDGAQAAVEVLLQVAKNPGHPQWAAAQRLLWERTDGVPVRQVMVGTIERQLLESIELHPDKLDVPLPISTRGTHH